MQVQPESRRARKKREMREAILRTAFERFSRDGFDATSLRSIADELDVSVPTLRNYFGSKDGLLVATLERGIGVIDIGVREIIGRGLTETDEALELVLTLDPSLTAVSRDLLAHVMRTAATEPDVARILEHLRATLETLVVYAQEKAGGRLDVPADRLAQMLADLIIGAMVGWVQSAETDPGAHTEFVLRNAMELVVPPKGERKPSRAEQALEAATLPESAPTTRTTRSELPDQILEVSRRRFAENGFRETSLEAIADELSISQLTIFYHFGTKDGLLAHLAIEIADIIESAVHQALSGDGPRDLRKGIALIPGRIAELPDFGRKLTAELLRVMLTHPDAIAASRRIHAAMARLVAEGQRGDLVRADHGPNILARIVLDLCYGRILGWIQDPEQPVSEAAQDAMRSVRLVLATADAPSVSLI